MVAQTRSVLERYADAGGSYHEIAQRACGHSAHIEYPEMATDAIVELVAGAGRPV